MAPSKQPRVTETGLDGPSRVHHIILKHTSVLSKRVTRPASADRNTDLAHAISHKKNVRLVLVAHASDNIGALADIRAANSAMLARRAGNIVNDFLGCLSSEGLKRKVAVIPRNVVLQG